MLVGQELSGLMQFLKREDWPDHFRSVHALHIGEALDRAGLDEPDDLAMLIGGEATTALWGCAFEDFLTQTFGPDDRNLIDVYLAKRAWKETPAAKAYMKALRTSVMTLYEVTSIVPGKSFKVRDLVRGGDAVTVYEGTASRSLMDGAVIGCRVVTVLGRVGISGGLLGIPPATVPLLLDTLAELSGKSVPAPWPDIADGVLRRAAPLFTNAWLEAVMSDVLGDEDGEGDDGDLVLHDIEFPLAEGVTHKAVKAALAGIPGLVAQDGNSWWWTDDEDQLDELDLTSHLGHLELEGRTLTLSVESEALADAGVEMLEAALGDLVGEPKITAASIDDILADPEYADIFADDDDDDFADILGEDAGDDPLDRAQTLVYDAWEASSKKQKISAARKALEISPLCADAWVILADEESDPAKRAELYRQGVEAGEKAIGPAAFKTDKGHFWGILETRPYMRARSGLAQSLWLTGKQDEAIAHLSDMLTLNPNDNQGLRYVLSDYLLARDERKALAKLFKQYDDDGSAAWLYSRALLAFREKSPSAPKLARDAFDANTHVPALLSGLKKPVKTRGYITVGGADEAASYVEHNRQAWQDTPGAVTWLSEALAFKAANDG